MRYCACIKSNNNEIKPEENKMIKIFFLTFMIMLFFALALGLKALIKNETIQDHSCHPKDEKDGQQNSCAMCNHTGCGYSKG